MPTDPAVEALARPLDDVLGELVAWVSFALDVPVALSEAALDHIAAHLHDDTPEGAALRGRFALAVQTCNDSEDETDWPRPSTERVEVAKGRYEYRTHTPTRLVSPWRDA